MIVGLVGLGLTCLGVGPVEGILGWIAIWQLLCSFPSACESLLERNATVCLRCSRGGLPCWCRLLRCTGHRVTATLTAGRHGLRLRWRLRAIPRAGWRNVGDVWLSGNHWLCGWLATTAWCHSLCGRGLCLPRLHLCLSRWFLCGGLLWCLLWCRLWLNLRYHGWHELRLRAPSPRLLYRLLRGWGGRFYPR